MSNDIQSNNKRIAKNTILLYFRMFITMTVSLYTSRLVLNILGIEDFGIYNIVGSLIVAFSFISGPLAAATQRFYNFELGKKNIEGVNSIYNHSLIIYLILALVLLLIIGIAGYWFIANKMVLPTDRTVAAKWVFFFSQLSFIIGLLRVPYESLIISHERMNFYAYVTITDVILKLLMVFSLVYVNLDKLIFYAFGIFILGICYNLCAIIYCHKQFRYIHFQKRWDKKIFKSLLGFSGWSLFGSIATMTQNQGLNILLNIFFGVVVNAAMGVAAQVSGSINQFVTNFQMAFRPQIVKSYAANEISSLKSLITNTSKYSYLLLFTIICPISFNIDFVLHLWLGTVPENASSFCICMLIYALLETLSAPLWMTIQATGEIKAYQIAIGLIIGLNIVFSYIFLKFGFPPVIVLAIKCFLDLGNLAVRLFFAKKLINYPITIFVKNVILPLFCSTLISILLMIILSSMIEEGWHKLLISCIVMIIFALPLSLMISVPLYERRHAFAVIKKKLYL